MLVFVITGPPGPKAQDLRQAHWNTGLATQAAGRGRGRGQLQALLVVHHALLLGQTSCVWGGVSQWGVAYDGQWRVGGTASKEWVGRPVESGLRE